jgi:hypothetical protein
MLQVKAEGTAGVVAQGITVADREPVQRVGGLEPLGVVHRY